MWHVDRDSRESVTGAGEAVSRLSLGTAEQEIEGSLGGGNGACCKGNTR